MSKESMKRVDTKPTNQMLLEVGASVISGSAGGALIGAELAGLSGGIVGAVIGGVINGSISISGAMSKNASSSN